MIELTPKQKALLRDRIKRDNFDYYYATRLATWVVTRKEGYGKDYFTQSYQEVVNKAFKDLIKTKIPEIDLIESEENGIKFNTMPNCCFRFPIIVPNVNSKLNLPEIYDLSDYLSPEMKKRYKDSSFSKSIDIIDLLADLEINTFEFMNLLKQVDEDLQTVGSKINEIRLKLVECRTISTAMEVVGEENFINFYTGTHSDKDIQKILNMRDIDEFTKCVDLMF